MYQDVLAKKLYSYVIFIVFARCNGTQMQPVYGHVLLLSDVSKCTNLSILLVPENEILVLQY